MKLVAMSLIASLGFAFAANANVIRMNIYQDHFRVDGRMLSTSIDGVKIRNAATVIDRIENPDYDRMEGTGRPFDDTVLQSEKALEIRITYNYDSGNEIDAEYITTYLPLSMFSADELATLSSKWPWKRMSVIKNRIAIKLQTVSQRVSELVCNDPTFDDFNNRIEDCPRLGTRVSTVSHNELVITRK